ncbi:MAG: GIY-YIG nuclease family protein [Microcystis sp. M38BS1]|uniref:GIY-YIG nuclease family protein n=1 Tax=Microcystis sp. M38BS1 TaxID=2771188 RepID=UPI0031FDE373|nr:GIY-YIG nuclease family protein [Microcystis sp. M38BS1]MCA6582559.1 GIY-YIG nuclease family protein [Pseudanabaena sp. M34BS1SP1A06MG]
MRKKVTAIYKITSKITGKIYIGSSINVGRRWSHHLWALRTKKHGNKHLQQHSEKYGLEDLQFSILEVIEDSKNGCTDEYIEFLLKREKYYADLLDPEFNIATVGVCPAKNRIKDSKYYIYNKKDNVYIVKYTLDKDMYYFGRYAEEIDAINRVSYLKSLSREELLLERAKYQPKNYYYDDKLNMYSVRIQVEAMQLSFNSFKNEGEAIKEVQYLRTLSKEQLLSIAEQIRKDKKTQTRIKNKNYHFDKRNKKFIVAFDVDNARLTFGSYTEEQEAKEKVQYLRTLSKENLIAAAHKKPEPKYYTYVKRTGKYVVDYPIKDKTAKYFNCETEEQAKQKVEEFKKLYPKYK